MIVTSRSTPRRAIAEQHRAKRPFLPNRRDPIVEQITRIVEDVRGLIDDVLVQADLVAMDVRDDLKQRSLDIQNGWLATKGRIDQAVREAEAEAKAER